MQPVEQRRGLVSENHYLNMLDLYALRVARTRILPLERAETPPVIFIGRKPRPKLSVLVSRDRNANLLTGRRRIASIATTAAVALSILAGAAFV